MIQDSRKFYGTVGLFIIFLLVFIYKDFFSEAIYQDEHHYFPTIVQFSKEPIPSIDLLKNYDELNTPVPFIIGGWVVRIFGESIFTLRMFTFVTSFLLLMLFVWSAPEQPKRLYRCLIGLFLLPSYYLCSIYYFTDIYAMIFVLAGLIAYRGGKHLLSTICMMLAISSRQYMLAFPMAILAYEFLKNGFPQPFFSAILKQVRQQTAWRYYLVAVLSLLPWILLWGGMAPAQVMESQYYEADKLTHYNYGYVLYVMGILAFYYVIPETIFFGTWKYYLQYPRNEPVRFGIFVMIVAVLVLFFPMRQASNPYFTWPYLGYVDQLFESVLRISGHPKKVIFGLMMLVTCIRFFSGRLSLVSYIVLFNVLLLGKAQLSWDKYSLPMMMALWYLAMFDSEWLFARKETSVQTS